MPRLRLSELTWSRRGEDGGEMIKNRAKSYLNIRQGVTSIYYLIFPRQGPCINNKWAGSLLTKLYPNPKSI